MITRHAIVRYLQRIEGLSEREAEEAAHAERKRVSSLLLTPSVKAACRARSAVPIKIATPVARICVINGDVVTVEFTSAKGIRETRYHKANKSNRTRKWLTKANRLENTPPRRPNWKRDAFMEITE